MISIFCPAESIFASWLGCEAKVNSLLKSERELFILKENKDIFDKLQLAKCDGDLAVNLMVAIHEGVHFIDLGINNPQQIAVNPDKALLFLTDMTRLPIPRLELPSPYEIFEVHGKNLNVIRTLKESANVEYTEYVLERNMLSSQDIRAGFGTEFNAYCHGTLTGQALLPQSILPLVTQRTGLIAFIGLTVSYFDILKKKFPSKWEQVLADQETLNFYKKLLVQGIEVLRVTSHCESIQEDEVEYFSIFGPMINEGILKSFQISTRPDDIKQFALCK